ncbi:MAG: D-alanyl-D-alanine carboxypeptidase family protein [Acidobacteriota bacterium]
MDRRSVAVCTTVTLSLLAFVDASAARPSNKSSRAAVRSPALNHTRSLESKTPAARRARSCAPCSAELARNRKARALAKRGKNAKNLPCHPKNYVDPKIAKNYKAALRDMKRAGIKPKITSVWRSSEDQAQLRRCSLSTRCRRANPGLYRALPAGKSMHEAGFAVDMAGIAAGPRGAKRLTPKGLRIVGIMRKNGFNWRYGLADPAHFEANPRKHGYRTVQQAITRTQTTCQIKLVKTRAHKKPANKVAVNRAQSPAKRRLQAEATAIKDTTSRGKSQSVAHMTRGNATS